MDVLDLFSGIGGFSLGLERAGMRTIAFCERDKFCRRVLDSRWPGIQILEDVRSARFPTADIIVGGFPCQDISDAGNRSARAGLSGDRSGLFWEIVRAVRLVRPRFVILENVAALLRRGMGTVLGALAARGYDAEWDCLPALAVGAPIIRDRVVIVAESNREGQRRLEERNIFQEAGFTPPRRHHVDGLDLVEQGAWSACPELCRVDYGLPGTVDRLSALGNSVNPEIIRRIGVALSARC